MRRVNVTPFQPFDQQFNKRRGHVKTMVVGLAAMVAAWGCSEPSTMAPSEEVADRAREIVDTVLPEMAPTPSTEFKKIEMDHPTRLRIHSAPVETDALEVAAAPVLCTQGQIYGNAQHTGLPCAPLPDLGVAAELLQDPRADAQADARGGFLAVHYGIPLTSKTGWVYVPSKDGWTSPSTIGDQTWSVDAYQWVGATLAKRWSVDTMWKPFDAINPFGTTSGYEQLFQPALTNAGLYVPSAAGQVSKLNPLTGTLIQQIDPLAGTPFSGDSATIVNSALTADDRGNVYFTVVAWDPTGNSSISPRESFLVRISPTDQVTRVPWTQIATREVGVRQENDMCSYSFQFASPQPQRPWPPSPDAVPPQFTCRKPRPVVNAAPAVRPDGSSVVLMMMNHVGTNHAYLVEYSFAEGRSLWGTTMRDQIADGCGVLIPINGPDNSNLSACRFGSRLAVDPETNELTAGRMPSFSEAAPVIAPDGTIYVSTYSKSNYAPHDHHRGHVHHFGPTGQFLGLIDYGFETTPAIVRGSGTSFSIAQDYSAPDEFGLASATARLTASLRLTAVTRVLPIGDASDDWLDGQPAVDSAGNHYGLNASGHLYKVSPQGTILDGPLHLDRSIVALNSEMSWGSDGLRRPVLYVPFAGKVFVIGQSGSTN